MDGFVWSNKICGARPGNLLDPSTSGNSHYRGDWFCHWVGPHITWNILEWKSDSMIWTGLFSVPKQSTTTWSTGYSSQYPSNPPQPGQQVVYHSQESRDLQFLQIIGSQVNFHWENETLSPRLACVYRCVWIFSSGGKQKLILLLSYYFGIDESSFFDRDLLRTFMHSTQGTPATRFITNQNPDRISLMPAISTGGVIALTMTMDTFNRPKFKKFLEYNLVSFSSFSSIVPYLLLT